MTIQDLIDSYGYAVILIGTFVEGETVLVLGGVAAKMNYLELPWVIGCAFLGSLLGDQLLFFLGRRKGTLLLQKRPHWRARADRVLLLLERHKYVVMLGFRFLYGMRSVTPFVLGLSRVPVLEFVLCNVFSAALWASLFGTLGFVFGHALELLLGDIRRYEIGIFSAILIAGALLWLRGKVRRR